MTDRGLSDNVRVLLENSVCSYEELDLILFLWRTRSPCNVTQIAAAMQLSAAEVTELLVRLRKAQLTASLEGGRFTIEPSALTVVGALARTFEDNPIQVVKCLSQTAMRRLRKSTADAFAEAFERTRGKGPNEQH